MFWSILGSIATIIVAFILFHQLRPPTVTHDPRLTLDFASRSQIPETNIPKIAKEAIIGPSKSTLAQDSIPAKSAKSSQDDALLRVFDEL